MRLTYFLATALLFVGCCNTPSNELNLMKAEDFRATVDGKTTDLYTLTNGTLTMQVTTFGARVVSLWAPDREGNMADIVLGYEKIDRYINNTGERFLGSVVGRVANRIGAGKFTLEGTEYTTPQNNNGQTLHGGDKGLDMVVWDVVNQTENSIVLHYIAPDGQDGFPGNLDITMTYTLTPENEFRVDYRATTDKTTVVNLSHHSFSTSRARLEELLPTIYYRLMPIVLPLPTATLSLREKFAQWQAQHTISELLMPLAI